MGSRRRLDPVALDAARTGLGARRASQVAGCVVLEESGKSLDRPSGCL